MLPAGAAGAGPHTGAAYGQVARLLCHSHRRLPHLRHQGALDKDVTNLSNRTEPDMPVSLSGQIFMPTPRAAQHVSVAPLSHTA